MAQSPDIPADHSIHAHDSLVFGVRLRPSCDNQAVRSLADWFSFSFRWRKVTTQRYSAGPSDHEAEMKSSRRIGAGFVAVEQFRIHAAHECRLLKRRICSGNLGDSFVFSCMLQRFGVSSGRVGFSVLSTLDGMAKRILPGQLSMKYQASFP